MRQFIDIVSETSSRFGPIFHKTTSGISSFAEFDISKASSSSVLGPAVYATFGDAKWDAGHLKDGRVLKGYVRGDIIDLTQPLPRSDLDRLSEFVGRPLETVPLMTLEKRYGSVAAGLKAAGYAAAIHMGPGSSGKHIAVFDPKFIEEAVEEATLFERSGNSLVPLEGATVANYAGRMMVLVDFGGARIPFYLSTGDGGKANVKAGRWYPFFGIGSDGWINKTSQIDIANYFYSDKLKAIALKLDAQIGDIRDDQRPNRLTRAGIEEINKGLHPVAHGQPDAVKKLIPKIKGVIAKIGDKVAPLTSMATINPSIDAYKAGKLDWAGLSAKIKEAGASHDLVDYVLFQLAPPH